jgi:ribonuclease PH
MPRHDGRDFNQLRNINIETGYVKYPHGSVMISFGNTRVLCTVQVEEKVPPFIENRDVPQGWITAEYALMPACGLSRNPRAGYGKTTVKGRVYEIQRLIGRALRCALDLKQLGPRTLMIDCDVIQADGGTRTASITGAMVALEMAVAKLIKEGKLKETPITNQIAAVSIGLVDGKPCLDLDYIEDSKADTDLNLVMNKNGGFIEIQGTGEEAVFSRAELDKMLDMGEAGIKELFALQDKAIAQL